MAAISFEANRSKSNSLIFFRYSPAVCVLYLSIVSIRLTAFSRFSAVFFILYRAVPLSFVNSSPLSRIALLQAATREFCSDMLDMREISANCSFIRLINFCSSLCALTLTLPFIYRALWWSARTAEIKMDSRPRPRPRPRSA